MTSKKSNTQDSTASAVQKTHYNANALQDVQLCQTLSGTHQNTMHTVSIEVSGYIDLMRIVEHLGKAARIITDQDEGEAAVVSDLLHLQGQLLPFSEAEFLDKLLHKNDFLDDETVFEAA